MGTIENAPGDEKVGSALDGTRGQRVPRVDGGPTGGVQHLRISNRQNEMVQTCKMGWPFGGIAFDIESTPMSRLGSTCDR